jgi:hypothetical protein
MKYIFTFSEINYGRIEIESGHKPDRCKVINQILEGAADYHNTDFANFKLIGQERTTSKKERGHER